MNDTTNGKIELGRFQGMVLEALETLKKNADRDVEADHLERQRLYDHIALQHDKTNARIDRLSEEISQKKSDARATSAKISGIIVGVGLALQGVFLWWTT